MIFEINWTILLAMFAVLFRTCEQNLTLSNMEWGIERVGESGKEGLTFKGWPPIKENQFPGHSS